MGVVGYYGNTVWRRELAEVGRQTFGTLALPVGDGEPAHARVKHGKGDPAGRAPSAQQERCRPGRVEAALGTQGAQEACGVGVIAAESAFPVDNRVDRSNAQRRGVDGIDERKNGLFVRHGDVGPQILRSAQTVDPFGQSRRCRFPGQVGQVEVVVGVGRLVHRRRNAVAERVAD